MAQVLQLRRGTTAQNDAFTGAVAEVSVDTDRESLRVHDGSTMGGKEIADLQTAVPLLPAASSVSGSDTVPVIQSGVARKATKTQILNGIVDANIDAAANISGTKLANNAVTTAKIADSNVTTAKIADSNVTTAKIADSNVTTAKIADSNVTTAKIADSNVTTAKIADSNVTTAKINNLAVTSTKLAYDGGPMSGFRNRIINGNFDIWQRGTTFSADGYGSDHWYNGRAGTTCTMSREAFTVGQTDVPNEPTYFCRMTVSSVAGASNNARLRQLIENVRTLAGQTLTLSFYAKADAAKPIAVEFSQTFGTGGSPSTAVVGIGAQQINLTTSWQKFVVTVAVPSISGKALGTNNDHVLGLNIWFDAGSDFNSRTDTLGQQSGTFDIAQVQVEQGSVATPFEARPIGTELALCQRYFCKTYNISIAPASSSNDGSLIGYGIGVGSRPFFNWSFPVAMRTSPSCVVYSTTGASGKIRNIDNSTDVNALVFYTGTSGMSFYPDATVASAIAMAAQVTASSEL